MYIMSVKVEQSAIYRVNLRIVVHTHIRGCFLHEAKSRRNIRSILKTAFLFDTGIPFVKKNLGIAESKLLRLLFCILYILGNIRIAVPREEIEHLTVFCNICQEYIQKINKIINTTA